MTEPQVQLDRAVRVPHIDQWLGYWLMEPERGLQKLAAIQQMNIALHLQQVAQQAAGEPEATRVPRGYRYAVDDAGVAVVQLVGTLMKHESSDESSTSTVMMRRTVRAMAADEKVRAVVFVIDSPGGTVAGAYDLADDIAALAAVKPTYAYAQDLMASAAYLQGSQTRGISAGRTALVGSIGTVGVVYDTSARAAMLGVKVHVMVGRIDGKPAPMKGAGAAGREITQAQLDRWQEEIDALNEQFLQAVERGRRMPRAKVEEVADGGVWIAARARDLGLIDHVESFDQLMARVRTQVAGQPAPTGAGRQAAASPQNTNAGARAAGDDTTTAEASAGAEGSEAENPMEADMSQTDKAPAASEPKAATPAELKAACPGANSDFLFEQAEKGATVAQAKDAFLQFQAAQIRARDEEIAKLKAAAPVTEPAPTAAATATTEATKPATATKLPGVPATASAAAEVASKAGGGDAVAEFEGRVKALVDAGMPRAKASQKVLAEDEQLRARFIAAKNGKAA